MRCSQVLFFNHFDVSVKHVACLVGKNTKGYKEPRCFVYSLISHFFMQHPKGYLEDSQSTPCFPTEG